ncbi:MAG: hypothetical protein QOJ96_1355 [Alphaproteobacteria bacterium]|jgi:uncharacterized protein (DUF433 family)|nr:hypothetical protein [Alphaproteobacteria bacterium]
MNQSGKPDLLELGIFTVPEVAALVGAPQAAVRVWVGGHTGKQQAVIDNQLGRVHGKVAVSFTNLMELRFVAFFAKQGVGLREIRRIMDEAKDSLARPHPFATNTVFKTDGKKIVAEIARKNGVEGIYDLRSKNYEMRVVVLDSLKDDVVFDPNGDAISWCPRPTIAPNVIVHPMFSFGRPILRRSHIPTNAIADSVKVEGNAKFVSEIFDIPEKHVREAVCFEKSLRQAA